MRILHVSEVHWGGVVTLLRHFADEQSRHGHDVHLLAPGAFPRLGSVTHHDWGIVRGEPATYLPAVLQLGRLARELQADVVHLHSFVAGFLGRLSMLQPAGRPVVYQPHAWSSDLYTGSKRTLVERAERIAARTTDAVVTNCQDELEQGERQGIHRPAHVLGVAVDIDHLRPPTEEERLDAKAALGFSDRPMVLVLGRIAYQKAQDLLVPAWERHPLPEADLVLVGPGDVEHLRHLAPEQWGKSVHHAGETKDVRQWLWAADVLAIPSRYETVSLVAAEAMSTGLPVVATRFNGAVEAITAGPLPAGGEVVGSGDMPGVLTACARRLAQRGYDDTERIQARRRAEVLFRPENVYERLQSSYDDAISTYELTKV